MARQGSQMSAAQLLVTAGLALGAACQAADTLPTGPVVGMWGAASPVPLARGLANQRISLAMQDRAQEIVQVFVPIRFTNLFHLYVIGDQDYRGAFAQVRPPDPRETIPHPKRDIYYGQGFDFDLKDPLIVLESYLTLAHEMAHHMLEHTFETAPSADDELSADRVAACIVKALIQKGPMTVSKQTETIVGSLEDLRAIYRAPEHQPRDPSHPAAQARIKQIELGWAYATSGRSKYPRSPCSGVTAN